MKDKFLERRKELIEELRLKGIVDKRILDVIFKVKREIFVLDKRGAYLDIALPILENQTISQPYTVAIMIKSLELKRGDTVLEIGTGSGWCAGLIAEIIKPGIVYTTEIIDKLCHYAKKNLEKTRIKNVKVFNIDGSNGLEKYGKYDKIIISAACPKIPKHLLDQLKEKGILIAPVEKDNYQEMLKITKLRNKIEIKNLGNFVFVPLRGKYGF